MGLDMFLSVTQYIPRPGSVFAESTTEQYGIRSDAFDKIVDIVKMRSIVDESRWAGIEVKVPVAQWRKANAIHNFFVKEVAEGVDDCRPVYVHKGNLEDLRDRCTVVLNNNELALELLPPQAGFFFGPADLRNSRNMEWYLEYVLYTKEVCDKLLDSKYDSFEYLASW